MRLGVNMDNLNDVNLDGLNLWFGDCLERMKEIPDGSVDMILTDPPYIDCPKISLFNVINTLKGGIC